MKTIPVMITMRKICQNCDWGEEDSTNSQILYTAYFFWFVIASCGFKVSVVIVGPFRNQQRLRDQSMRSAFFLLLECKQLCTAAIAWNKVASVLFALSATFLVNCVHVVPSLVGEDDFSVGHFHQIPYWVEELWS